MYFILCGEGKISDLRFLVVRTGEAIGCLGFWVFFVFPLSKFDDFDFSVDEK